MSHNPLTRDFGRKLDRLHRLARLVEESLVAEAAALDSQLAAEAEKLDKDAAHDLYEFHAEDYVELSDELPTILRYSVLTAADSAFEVHLDETCHTFADVHKSNVRLNDFKNSGIRRAKEYMKKVAGIPFPDQSPAWLTVNRLHEIRNSIVHADGYVPPERSELRKWAGSLSGFSITSHGVITLKKDFVPFALSTYENFAAAFDEACAHLGLWQSVFPVEDV